MNTNGPLVTVDVLLFTIEGEDLKVLLVKRATEPFTNSWALPGRFIKADETLDGAILRTLRDETGVKDAYVEQLYTFGDPNRDPRARVITVSYLALTTNSLTDFEPTTDIQAVKWYSTKKLPKLAFDHKQIIEHGIQRLKSKIGYSNISFGLLPKKFRLSELQNVYEIILGQKLDKRNFRKRMLSLGLLEATGQKEIEGAHRPAMLYQFKHQEIVIFE